MNSKVLELAEKVEKRIAPRFAEIDAVSMKNTEKVLDAFREFRVSDVHFAGTNGYGHDDVGRDTLDQIYARVFGAESAIVRIGMVSGTHAISCALFAACEPGKTLLSISGMPYDSIRSAIGITGNYPGSLKYYGVDFDMVDLKPDSTPDYEAIRARAAMPDVGAMGCNAQLFRGFFMAPHTVAQALKTAVFCAGMLDELGYQSSPGVMDPRSDIVQIIELGSAEKLCAFCRGIQMGSPVDAFVTPVPSDMEGYEDKVVMASGSFVQGSTIELSCDGPLREPYAAYLQGGLTYEAGRLGIMYAINEMME